MPKQVTLQAQSSNPNQELLEVLFSIYLVGRKMKQVAKKHHPAQIHDLMLEMGILRLIADQPRLVSELADLLSTGLSATSERIKALVKAGFVRQNSGDDARQNWCGITSKGKKHLQITQAHMTQNCHAFAGSFSISELATVKEFMTKMLEKLI